jgi:hypothetical protein
MWKHVKKWQKKYCTQDFFISHTLHTTSGWLYWEKIWTIFSKHQFTWWIILSSEELFILHVFFQHYKKKLTAVIWHNHCYLHRVCIGNTPPARVTVSALENSRRYSNQAEIIESTSLSANTNSYYFPILARGQTKKYTNIEVIFNAHWLKKCN